MEIVNSLHHLLTHLSTPSKICLILSVIAWFVALVLVCYLQDNPETGWHSLFDRLIAGIFPFVTNTCITISNDVLRFVFSCRGCNPVAFLR